MMLLLLGVSGTPECRIRLLHFWDSTTVSVSPALSAATTAINADSSLLPGCTLEIHEEMYATKTQLVGQLIKSLPFMGEASNPEDSGSPEYSHNPDGWVWEKSNNLWAAKDAVVLSNGSPTRTVCCSPERFASGDSSECRDSSGANPQPQSNDCYYITIGVIAATGTQPTLMVNPIIQSKLVMHGSYSARGTSIDAQIVNPQAQGVTDALFFRTCPSDVPVVEAAAVLIQTLGWSKVGASVARHMQLFTLLISDYGPLGYIKPVEC